MLSLLQSGQILTFVMVLVTIVISLSFHEFGHAYAAKRYGDDTAERMGRLTLNPLAHIDPLGLLMVVMIGFGFAKPVPTNPRNYNSIWGQAGVAAAGPFANLLIAFVVINVYQLGLNNAWDAFLQPNALVFVRYLVLINLLLMLFNLLPIGPLDGHYILPYFLPRSVANHYRTLNAKYGMYAMLGLVLLSYLGLPIFRQLWTFAGNIVPYINFMD